MKVNALLIYLTLSITSSYSQRLSRNAIDEFANNANYYYLYDDSFKYYMTSLLPRMDSSYGMRDIPVIMRTIRTNTRGRENVLKSIAQIAGSDKNSINRQFMLLGMNEVYANEMAEYVFKKYKKF